MLTQKTHELALESPIIEITDNGSSLTIRQTYYSYFVKLPFFKNFSANEQNEVMRIFREVPYDLILKRASYHYANDRNSVNGYSYVIDNAKHIISLPESDTESIVMKFLMLCSLGKMKFLSKRNINLLFAERKAFVGKLYARPTMHDSMKTLNNLADFFELPNIFLYFNFLYNEKTAEPVYYINFTFARWFLHDDLTLHEVVMLQESFGHEVSSVYKALRPSYALREFTKSFVNAYEEYADYSISPWKAIFEEFPYFKKFSGVMNSKVSEIYAYSAFFNWDEVDYNSAFDNFYTFSKFQKELPKKWIDQQTYINFMFKSARVDLLHGRHRLVKGPELYSSELYLLFGFLNGDERKFLNVYNALGGDDHAFDNVSIQRLKFLEFIKFYANDTSNTPVNMLFNLYEIDLLRHSYK